MFLLILQEKAGVLWLGEFDLAMGRIKDIIYRQIKLWWVGKFSLFSKEVKETVCINKLDFGKSAIKFFPAQSKCLSIYELPVDASASRVYEIVRFHYRKFISCTRYPTMPGVQFSSEPSR